VVLLVGAILLLLVLIYTVQSVISPFLLLGAIIFLLYPLRGYALAKKIMWLSVIIFGVWFAGSISSVLAPFVVSLVLAYVMNPLVERFERWGVARWVTSASADLNYDGTNLDQAAHATAITQPDFIGVGYWAGTTRQNTYPTGPVLISPQRKSDAWVAAIQANSGAAYSDPMRLVRDFMQKEPYVAEAWYYGVVKGRPDKLVTRVRALGERRVLEFHVACSSTLMLTGMLAELKADLNRELEARKRETMMQVTAPEELTAVTQLRSLLDKMAESEGRPGETEPRPPGP
jgi:hypothetical protein